MGYLQAVTHTHNSHTHVHTIMHSHVFPQTQWSLQEGHRNSNSWNREAFLPLPGRCGGRVCVEFYTHTHVTTVCSMHTHDLHVCVCGNCRVCVFPYTHTHTHTHTHSHQKHQTHLSFSFLSVITVRVATDTVVRTRESPVSISRPFSCLSPCHSLAPCLCLSVYLYLAGWDLLLAGWIGNSDSETMKVEERARWRMQKESLIL
jgi:hypothetical protein